MDVSARERLRMSYDLQRHRIVVCGSQRTPRRGAVIELDTHGLTRVQLLNPSPCGIGRFPGLTVHRLTLSEIDDFTFVNQCVRKPTAQAPPDRAAEGADQRALAAFDAPARARGRISGPACQ